MPHDASTFGPTLWINTLSANLHITGRCTDCPCACPEPVPSSERQSRVETFSHDLKRGAIREISLNPDIFWGAVGDYTVAMSATQEPIVVLDHQAGQLLPVLRSPSTVEELRSRFSDWSDEALQRTTAVLLAAGVLHSPHVEQQGTNPSVGFTTLSAWLHLTDCCNLACQYCYVPRTGQEMTPVTAEHSIAAVYRSAVAHHCERITLKYAGGEPMLNLAALRAAQAEAEQQSVGTDIALDTVVLTNGTLLTDSLVDYMLAHGIQVMISLDGVGRYQDAQRPSKTRRNRSFELTANALDLVLHRGISPHVSVTITRQSLEGLSDLVEFLLDRQLEFSFNFYREPDGVSPDGPLSLLAEQAIAGLHRAFEVIERKMPRQSLLSNLADRADLGGRHLRACGAGQSYLVIGIHGEVSKCQMDMEHPVTTIAAADPLALVQADTAGIQNLTVGQNECRECVWRYRCAGGCPRLTFQRTASYDAKSPLCAIYRAILPEIVTLEALRLIRYDEPWGFKIHCAH